MVIMKKKDKEKILDALEGKSRAEVLAKKYVETERKLLEELGKLDNFGSECNCNEKTIIRTIFDGEFPEISTYCLKCGGYVNG